MSLNESMNPRERAKLAVWDYPVSDKFTNMWRFMQESKLPNTVEEAISRVLNSEKGDAMEIKYAILTNCKLQQIGPEFSRKPYAIAVQTGHALKDHISASILKLLNERKLETLKERWWHQNPKRKECPTLEDDSTGISIQNIGGVFIVILAGIAVSLIILFFEYLYYTHTNPKNDEMNGKTSNKPTENKETYRPAIELAANGRQRRFNAVQLQETLNVDQLPRIKALKNGQNKTTFTNSAFSYH